MPKRAPKEVAPTEEDLVREQEDLVREHLRTTEDKKLLFGGDGKCNLRTNERETTRVDPDARRPRKGGAETIPATSRQDKEAGASSKPNKEAASCRTVRGAQNRSETEQMRSDAGQVLGTTGGAAEGGCTLSDRARSAKPVGDRTNEVRRRPGPGGQLGVQLTGSRDTGGLHVAGPRAERKTGRRPNK